MTEANRPTAAGLGWRASSQVELSAVPDANRHHRRMSEGCTTKVQLVIAPGHLLFYLCRFL